MNVLHIVLSLQVGGLERVVLDLLKHGSDDFKARLCCLDEIREGGNEVRQMGIPYLELNNYGRNKIATIKALTRYIIENKIDVIHTHNPTPNLYGAIAGFLSKAPVINTKHGLNYQNPYNHIWLNRISSIFTEKIVCVSKDAREAILKIEKVPPDKTVLIYNGIESDKYDVRANEELKRELGITGGPIIGNVARIAPAKDHKTLIIAFKDVIKKVSDARLVIAGDGPLMDECRQLIRTLDLERKVLLLGNRNDIPDLLPLMDIFVLSSRSEGLPITLLEAMAAKLPIVCTNVGGNPEVVEDGNTGFVIPPEDPDIMAQKIILLSGDKQLQKQMGSAGYKRMKEYFDIKKTVSKYEEIYKSVSRKIR